MHSGMYGGMYDGMYRGMYGGMYGGRNLLTVSLIHVMKENILLSLLYGGLYVSDNRPVRYMSRRAALRSLVGRFSGIVVYLGHRVSKSTLH